jgi:hypothetical protein
MSRIAGNEGGFPGRVLAGRLTSLVDRIESALTPYDLFAIAVVYMVFAHFAESFVDKLWLRTGDRILVPVFLISVGYNVGRKIEWRILTGAVVVSFLRWFMFYHWLKPIPPGAYSVLVTIVACRLVIEPLMGFALKSRMHFWGVNLALAALAYYTNEHVALYGTLGLMMAMAGWMARSREEIPKNIVRVEDYFVLVFCFYIAFNQWYFHFSALQLGLITAGTALVFRLLYDMRRLLRNSLQRKPKDAVGRIVRFVGANSLEIYTFHMILYYGIYYYALSVPG